MNKKEFPQGVWPLDIFIGSIEKTSPSETIEGRSGKVSYGQTYYTRPIEISVGLKPYDTIDYRLLRDELFSFFNDEEFYISEEYQKGKRYKVTVPQSYIPERLNKRTARVNIPLELVDLPFAESIGTSQDIQQNGINANDELWGYGMGLIADDESLIYTHHADADAPFQIYNAGNVPIHPFEQELKIKIKDVVGSTGMFQITNLTNGSRSRVNVPLSTSDVVIYDRSNITRNGLAFTRDTRLDFIELNPGWNNFQIYYCDSATIEFDFRFYYL